MHFFKEELKSTKASRKKLQERLRMLRRYIFWHYLLVASSVAQASITLYIVLNYPGPDKEVLAILLFFSLIIGVYLLVSGLSTK